MGFLHRSWAEIDTSALVHNIKTIQRHMPDSKLMAVVKANAYGHGVEIVAPVLEQNGVESFGVSNLQEALQLRKIGIKKSILILGYTPVEEVKLLSQYNIAQCVYSLEYAKMLSDEAVKSDVKIDIHIKLDTGMGRLGFDCRSDKLNGISDAIASAGLRGLCFKGVFTHFADSDRSEVNEDGFTNLQYSRFKTAINIFRQNNLEPQICHCCNSAAIIKDTDKQYNMCRAGIILYGLSPSNAPELQCGLKPVMTLKSVVSEVKEILAGETISYGRTFIAEKNLKVATVSIGYADGYPRLLSNKAYVLIKGKKARVLGRVCMDQMVVDITEIPVVKIGDEVILFGSELSVDILAQLCNTINYEIVCGIGNRVPRVEKL